MSWLPSLPSSYNTLHISLAFAAGAALALIINELIESSDYHFRSRLPSIFLTDEAANLISSLSNPKPSNSDQSYTPPVGSGLESAIGNTPLILPPHLSELVQCRIYAKVELLNPGGSPKDRVALSILNHLSLPNPSDPTGPTLQAGDTIYEGTVGSTGISLAMICRSRGLLAHIIMPSDQSIEKSELLLKLGAKVTKVPPAPIIDQEHFVNVARRMARVQTEEFERGEMVDVLEEENAEDGSKIEVKRRRRKWSGRGWFADQFETEANWRAHYEGTGPEILRQMEHEGSGHARIDAFVAGAGTGGTITGVGMYLKEKLGDECKVILADPQGSGLYNKVKHGVFWSEYEREGTRRREQVDTVIEGIGLVRSTRNWEVGFENGVVDDAVKVSDQMARNMARWLVEKEGIWVGGSSAVNCVAAIQTALKLGPGHRIVTILCDSGSRHISKFWKQIGDIGGQARVELDDILQGSELT